MVDEGRYGEKTTFPCTIMRGGTSKGIFLMEKDLPEDPGLRDRIILAVFRSPDIRQIDGLGGADSLTSKLAIIGPAKSRIMTSTTTSERWESTRPS